jgi:hypothetical protein
LDAGLNTPTSLQEIIGAKQEGVFYITALYQKTGVFQEQNLF